MADNKKQNDNNMPKGHLDQVPIYADLLKANRRNCHPEGFDYDADTFENLIDNYTPYDDVPKLLSISCGHSVTISELDAFCKLLYGMTYKDTYQILIGITDMYMRKVIKNLGASGNATALAITAKHFMKLDDDAKNDAINIRIVNDLNEKK